MSEMKMLDMPVPEYFVTHIGKAESVDGDCVRFYMCVKKGEFLEPVYCSVWPLKCVLARGELIGVINDAIVWRDGAMH